MASTYIRTNLTTEPESSIGEVVDIDLRIAQIKEYCEANYNYYTIAVNYDSVSNIISYFAYSLGDGAVPDDVVKYTSSKIEDGTSTMKWLLWTANRLTEIQYGWTEQLYYANESNIPYPKETQKLLIYDDIQTTTPSIDDWSTTWLENYAPTALAWRRIV